MFQFILFIISNLLLIVLINAIIGYISSYIACCFIISVSLAYFVLIIRNKGLNKYSFPLSCGYILRLFLLILDRYGKKIIKLRGSGADSEGFYTATYLCSKGYKVTYGAPFTTCFGYVAKYISTNRLLLQYICLLFSVIAIIYFAKALFLINVEEKNKYFSILLLCILPNYAILSSIYLRESLISMYVSISIYYFLCWVLCGHPKKLIISFIFSLLGSTLHSGIIGLAVGYIIVLLIFDRKNNSFKLKIKNIIFTIIFIIIFVYIFKNYNSTFFSYFKGIDSINDISDGQGLGGSTYAKYVGNSNSIINMAIYTIPRILYFLFSPFLWQWRGLSDIIATFFNSLFYIITVLNTVNYLKKEIGPNRNIIITLIIVALSTAFIYSWGCTNTGTAIRHRDKMIILYSILWCYTYKNTAYKIRIN